MTNEHSWYYLQRAKTALEMAEKASDPSIAAIHLDFYNRYMDGAHSPESEESTVRIVPRKS